MTLRHYLDDVCPIKDPEDIYEPVEMFELEGEELVLLADDEDLATLDRQPREC